MFKAHNLTLGVDHFAVFGNPVKHSKSPQIHSLFAEQFNISIKYQAVCVDPARFVEAVNEFASLGGKGLNITIPFKEDAYRLCDTRTHRAEMSQSVNTLWFHVDGRINGDTTDGQGLINDLTINNDIQLEGKSVLIIGAGGAARAILQPLLKRNPAMLMIANRTVEKANALALQFSGASTVTACGYDELTNQRFDVIINATSLSMHGKLPPIPDNLAKLVSCCYDLMYGDTDTVFMRWANRHGVKIVLDGLGMLVEQAAESFRIWHGVKPETGRVITALRSAHGGSK